MDFLHNANQRIEGNDQNKEHIGPRADKRQGNGDQHVKQIKQRADIVLQNLPGCFGHFFRFGVLSSVASFFFDLFGS